MSDAVSSIGDPRELNCVYFSFTSVITHTVVGMSSPPPDVTNLQLEGNYLRWTATKPKDFDHFTVRDATDVAAAPAVACQAACECSPGACRVPCTRPSVVVNPTMIPLMKGNARRAPKFAPSDSNIVLLGPGVTAVTKPNTAIDTARFQVTR